MASADFLNSYCAAFLGEKQAINKKKKKSKAKRLGTLPRKSDILQDSIDLLDSSEPNYKTEKLNPNVLKNKSSVLSGTDITDDGFKIVSHIPLDDSDISDGFESDIDEEKWEMNIPKKKYKISEKQNSSEIFGAKVTEDGFKIISDIPMDDSDVSDAFESDIDEEQWRKDVEIHKLKSGFANNATGTEIENKLMNVKKPLYDLIKEFGLEDRILSRLSKDDTNTKSSHTMTVFDYSKKRGKKYAGLGKNKQETNALNKNLSKENQTKEDELKQEFKKARHDVFKLGVSGFDKEQKQNAKIALAIRLGAKPPKNIAKNYKTIMQEKNAAKKLEKEKAESNEDPRWLSNKSKVKTAPTKKKDNSLLHGITTGKFQGGVLKLSKSDIKKIQSSR